MPSRVVDKQRLRDLLADALRRERDTLLAAHRASRRGATHEESRAEGSKDMRATELSYLARGQAQRVEELERDLLVVERLELREFGNHSPIAASALVELTSERGTTRIWLVPAGGGTELELGGSKLRVVTPTSPLGSALVGTSVGDLVEVERGGETLEFQVVRVG